MIDKINIDPYDKAIKVIYSLGAKKDNGQIMFCLTGPHSIEGNLFPDIHKTDLWFMRI